MVVHLCSWARLRWTAGDSYPVPTVPKEQALNYLKRKRAARMKIKEEKTFQRELFTGHDSGASDVPLQPGSQLQNESPSLFIFFPPRIAEQSASAMAFDPVALLLLSLLRCQHRLLFVTSQSCSEFSPLLFLWRRIQAQMVEMSFAPRRRLDGKRRELPFGKAIRSTLRVWPSRVYMQ